MVARTRRVLLAKPLIHETLLPIGEVALASGFGSVRRLNEALQQLFDRPPGELRRSRQAGRAPAQVREAFEGYFSGDPSALAGVAWSTVGTALQLSVRVARDLSTAVAHQS